MRPCISLLLWGWMCLATVIRGADRPNVLMILVDDLKPTLGCYGDAIVHSPNIDRLAKRGMRFDLAYCNQAVCAPSRFTLMLGSHSTSTGLYGLGSQLRQLVPDAVTMPQFFAKHGYRTESLGKVFHIGHGNNGDPMSFSVEHFHDKVIEYADPASTDGGQLTREEAYFTNQQLNRIRQLPRGSAYESPNVADEAYADGRIANETIRRLREARRRRDEDGTPFFMVTGFARPHLPFSAPKRFWDLYDPSRLPVSSTHVPPQGAPQVAGKTNGELANYKPVSASGEVDNVLRQQLIHGYYASVSYVDAQIGKVLDELDRQQLADNTIVVLWGDHGFHLGDHGYWTKHTNYEQANRIPLLIAAPGTTAPSSTSRQLAESVDVFPTLAELAGLPKLNGPQRIDGKSLVPVLRDPNARVRDHAYHIFPKGKLGRAIRTERYRLVEWKNVDDRAETAELELYDYELDPQETRNIANNQVEIVNQLRAILATYPDPVDPNGKPRTQLAKEKAATSIRSEQANSERTVQSLESSTSTTQRPNIIFVLSDDLAMGDVGCYGQKLIQTPNLDRMAAEGTRYTRAYCGTSVCAPSRSSLMTGLHSGHCPVRANWEIAPGEGQQPLPANTLTVAQVLLSGGYATACMGKWGMGMFDTPGSPLKKGFDHFYGYNCQRHAHSYFPTYLYDDDHRFDLSGNDGKSVGKTYAQELIQQDVERWVRSNKSGPFFLFYAITLPHGRHEIDQLGPYADKDWTPQQKAYAAQVSRLDSDIGRLLALLKELKIDDNTLVMVAGDNGSSFDTKSEIGQLFDQSMGGRLRGFKRGLYEGGLRQAAIARWPGKVPAGRLTDEPWAFWDFLPTAAELAGVGVPSSFKPDGHSLVSFLKGGPAPTRDYFYWELHEGPSIQAACFGDWKAVRNGPDKPIEIYDLKNDLAESNNLGNDRPDVVARADAIFREAHTDIPEWPMVKNKQQRTEARQRVGLRP